MNREQVLGTPKVPRTESQARTPNAMLRLAIHKNGPGRVKLEGDSASSNRTILSMIIDASFKLWLPQLTSMLRRYPGTILYIGRSGDRIHAQLRATNRDVSVIDPFDPKALAHEHVRPLYGAIIVPGLAFSALGLSGQGESFLTLVSEQLAPNGLIVTDLPNLAPRGRSSTASDLSGNGREGLAPDLAAAIACDPEGNIKLLDENQWTASGWFDEHWEWIDVKLDEVLELECLLISRGFTETYRTPSMPHGSISRMYAFKGDNRAPLCHPFSPFTISGTPGRVLVLTEGQGCKVRDAEGKEYIDACGGLWNTHLGLGNAELIDAMTAQLRKLSFGTLFGERGHQSAVELANELIALAPYPMQWVCYTGSGSECTEVALRVALYYQVLAGRRDRKRIAYLDESYHGSFAAGSCVSGLNQFRGLGAGAVSSVALPAPNPDKCPQRSDFHTFAVQCANALEAQAKAGDVAAFIVEPILASAGVLVPPKAYFERIRAICDTYDILLILDEVATGFGRTGRWFASEHFELRPDIVTVSKGINSGYAPFGAVFFSAAIGEQFSASGTPLPHGSTCNGHPMCCASALATIKILRRERLVERAEVMGNFLMKSLEEELSGLECVKGVRGVGLMCAVVLRQTDGSPPLSQQIYEIYKRLQTAGILLYASPTALTLAPALVISEEEIALVASKIRGVLSALRWTTRG